MQREIKRKTVVYGFAAVLLAVLLASLCYNFGVQPVIQQVFPGLNTFSSYEELKNFIKKNMERVEAKYTVFSGQGGLDKGLPLIPAPVPAPTITGSETSAREYSTTNIQVEGVDEADIVKTDGNYLYVVSGEYVYILRAYPPDMAVVLSKIFLKETYNLEVYINGDKLVALGLLGMGPLKALPYVYAEEAFINVYDISNRSQPKLTRNLRLTGYISGSRMIGNYLYAVVTKQAIRPSETNVTDFEVDLPKIIQGENVRVVQPSEVRYINVSDASYSFTTIVAVNILDDAKQPTYETILKSATSCMYVSMENMYLAVPNINLWILSAEIGEPQYETAIYRVNLDEDKIEWQATGYVPGHVLNQFSMDEYNGFFRIATTNGWGDKATNNVFILDMNLTTVGKLINLDPGKRIYSARFIGERCYLVTFYQKDPFFVIDVGNPYKPEVLGFLEIEGFSGYLHPYDQNHMIGIGMEEARVKLSLYNVTEVKNPKEIDKYLIPSETIKTQWATTTVLSDHKAFLFNKQKQLLALPITISWAEIEIQNEKEERYTKGYWQGAYVFNITLTGFKFKGSITHQDENGGYELKRILYIEDILYTISDGKVKLNALGNLTQIKEIILS
jgi:uncharacterized secreted protein with C-terminal beta-propeller domain